jgi:hypothetical protein
MATESSPPKNLESIKESLDLQTSTASLSQVGWKNAFAMPSSIHHRIFHQAAISGSSAIKYSRDQRKMFG